MLETSDSDVAAALRACLKADSPDFVYVCANPEGVLDPAIPKRIEQGLSGLVHVKARWSLAGASGLMPGGQA